MRSVFSFLSALSGSNHSLGHLFASVTGRLTSWSLQPDCCTSAFQSARQPGLGWAPTQQRSWCTLQGAFIEVAASDICSCTFRTASSNAECWSGRRQLLALPSGRLNLQRMCWFLTPHKLWERSVLFWTLAFSIRVKYIVCYYHTVKLIFNILCTIYLRFHWTKQASGIEVS